MGHTHTQCGWGICRQPAVHDPPPNPHPPPPRSYWHYAVIVLLITLVAAAVSLSISRSNFRRLRALSRHDSRPKVRRPGGAPDARVPSALLAPGDVFVVEENSCARGGRPPRVLVY